MKILALLAWVTESVARQYHSTFFQGMEDTLKNDLLRETWKTTALYKTQTKSELEKTCHQLRIPVSVSLVKHDLVKLISEKRGEQEPLTPIKYSGKLEAIPTTTTALRLQYEDPDTPALKTTCEEQDDDTDPAVVISWGTDHDIHACLGLANPPVVPGADEYHSAAALRRWVTQEATAVLQRSQLVNNSVCRHKPHLEGGFQFLTKSGDSPSKYIKRGISTVGM